jgi:lipoprotein LpqH
MRVKTKEKTVKREVIITVGAAAVVVAGVAGCGGSDNKSPTTSSSATSSSASSTTAPATTPSVSVTVSTGAGQAKISIDGQPQDTANQAVVCATTGGKFSIAVGEPMMGTIVGLEQDGSVVHNVGLGSINGTVLSFTEGAPGNTATAKKDGNTYTITGTATGVDMANPTQQVSKSFEIVATCP